MKRCFHAVSLLLACGVLATAAPAFANRTAGRTPISLEGRTLRTVKIGSPASTHVACTLGETRPPAWINPGYLFPPDDRYYTYLQYSNCPGCGPGGLLVTAAHVVLYFEAPCSIPVEVSIVPVANPGSACPTPNLDQTLCGPVPFMLNVDNVGGYDFILNLGQPCCITGDAFLLIRFPDPGTCSPFPDLVAADQPCNPCFSYNFNPSFGFIDMCSDPFWQQYATGNPNMYVDTDCCTVTPTHPGTWGRLKQLYR